MGIGTLLQGLIKCRGTNVNEISKATGVSASTLYSIIKRDNMKANIDDLYKVSKYLGVTLDYFYSNYIDETSTTPYNLSLQAIEVAQAYEYADLKDKNTARNALDLPPLKKEDEPSKSNSTHIPDIEKITQEALEFKKAMNKAQLKK